MKKVFNSFMGSPMIAILIGLVLFGLGVGLTYKQCQLKQEGLQARGEVIRLAESCDDDGCRYRPIVEFVAQDRQTITFSSSYSTDPPAFQVGEIVTLYYRPDNPQDTLIEGEGGLFRFIVMSAGVGAVVVGFVLFARKLKQSFMAEA